MVYKDKCAWLGLDDDCGSLFPETVKLLCYIFVLLALLRKNKQTTETLQTASAQQCTSADVYRNMKLQTRR